MWERKTGTWAGETGAGVLHLHVPRLTGGDTSDRLERSSQTTIVLQWTELLAKLVRIKWIKCVLNFHEKISSNTCPKQCTCTSRLYSTLKLCRGPERVAQSLTNYFACNPKSMLLLDFHRSLINQELCCLSFAYFARQWCR